MKEDSWCLYPLEFSELRFTFRKTKMVLIFFTFSPVLHSLLAL
jgi:hypothetical protein